MHDIKYLDITKPQEVTYCVPLWLRDEQIKFAISKIKNRISPNYEKRKDPVAIVCYGPSLNETWEKIKDFKYIISCSGSHKFLIDREIIPTWHVEVDPRPHKVDLIGTPHKDVEYLIASTCSPKLLNHLENYNIKLWHIFDQKRDSLRALPNGEWALTGGCGVGLRSLTIARFLGFTDLHIFGMDSSEGDNGKHAGPHPNQSDDFYFVEYDGLTYKTTPAMVECARQVWHELDQMPDVKSTFYGNGLIQHMAKNYKPDHIEIDKAIIAINKPELISKEYANLNTNLHSEFLTYGTGGDRHVENIMKFVEKFKIKSILDYGCGKGYLAKSLSFPIWEYDPAIPGKDDSPRKSELVVCTNVLEHVEPEKLFFVLGDLRRCVQKFGYFIIDTGPAQKFLSNGRNAHLVQEDAEWWTKLLIQFFDIDEIMECGKELLFILKSRELETIKENNE